MTKHLPESVSTDTEIGGLIYRLRGKLYATDVVRGPCTAASGDCSLKLEDAFNMIPSGGEPVADWHLHGKSAGPDSRWMSLEDIASSNNAGRSAKSFFGSFVGTDDGNIRFYRSGSFNAPSYQSIRAMDEASYWKLSEESRTKQPYISINGKK